MTIPRRTSFFEGLDRSRRSMIDGTLRGQVRSATPFRPRPVGGERMVITPSAGQGAANESLALVGSSQTIVSGGDYISWTFERVGALHAKTGFSGYGAPPTETITMPTSGRLGVDLWAVWDSYTGGGPVTLELTRNGSVIDTWTVPGLTDSGQQFGGHVYVTVQRGDTLKVEVNQTSGSDKTLASAEIVLTLWPTIVATAGSSYRELVLSDNPIVYWRLGESAGPTAADETGNGHDGTYNGSPGYGAAGAIANDPDTAVDFGTNDFINAADSVDFDLQTLTMECWFDTDYGGSGRGGSTFLFHHGGNTLGGSGAYNWGLQETSAGVVGFVVVDAGGTEHVINIDQADVAAAGYHHIVGTYDGTTHAIYLDGALYDSAPLSVTVRTGSGVLVAGRWNNGPIYLDGRLDEVALYGRALTATEVAEHYLAGIGG